MLEYYHFSFPSKLFVIVGNWSYSWLLDNVWEWQGRKPKGSHREKIKTVLKVTVLFLFVELLWRSKEDSES